MARSSTYEFKDGWMGGKRLLESWPRILQVRPITWGMIRQIAPLADQGSHGCPM